MYRFDLLEREPLRITLGQYMAGSMSAACVLLVLWAIVLFTGFAFGWLVAPGFPVAAIGGLGMLIKLHGWKDRALGFLCWLPVWVVTYFAGVLMLFGISGSP
jgi:hypothetical protein